MIRVVKVGGSLLDWPQLPWAIERCFKQQPPACNVLIAGGGALADVVRRADRNFALGSERSHWLCIEAMSITAQVLAIAMPTCRHTSEFSELNDLLSMEGGGVVVFDVGKFLHIHEPHVGGRPLPKDWSVTSDSIAARLAQSVAADELLLLKSADPTAGSLAELAACGYVDAFFPIAAAELAVRFVNLRSIAV